jgi:hypothetical protein
MSDVADRKALRGLPTTEGNTIDSDAAHVGPGRTYLVRTIAKAIAEICIRA